MFYYYEIVRLFPIGLFEDETIQIYNICNTRWTYETINLKTVPRELENFSATFINTNFWKKCLEIIMILKTNVK